MNERGLSRKGQNDVARLFELFQARLSHDPAWSRLGREARELWEISLLAQVDGPVWPDEIALDHQIGLRSAQRLLGELHAAGAAEYVDGGGYMLRPAVGLL